MGQTRAPACAPAGLADTTPPVLTLPSPITAEATGPSGAAVTSTASATDAVDGARPVTCTPDSGLTFAIGPTTVNCSASDTHGNTGSASFTVTVVDTTPPTVTVQGDQPQEATSGAGAVVTFSASASDIVDVTDPVQCIPDSGSTFPLGQTPVTCSATDGAGNTASAIRVTQRLRILPSRSRSSRPTSTAPRSRSRSSARRATAC